MWTYTYTESMYQSDTNTTNELYHYGVPGMRWGHRRAAKFEGKATRARESAKEWDEMAKYQDEKGKSKKAAKYRQNAEKDRADAENYRIRAKELRGEKLTADEAVTALKNSEAHKQRVKQGAKIAAKVTFKVGTLAIGAAAATAATIHGIRALTGILDALAGN